MNNKKILTIIIGMVFLVNCIYAEKIIAGEEYFLDLGQPYSFYEITGNNSEINIGISQEGGIVKIISDKYMKSDSFVITFYGEKGESIGSSSSSYSSIPNLQNSLTKTIYKGNYVIFRLSQIHRLKLLEVDKQSVKIEVKSTPQLVELHLGKETKLSLEKEGYYDLSIFLEEIYSNGRAKITLREISEKIPERINNTEPIEPKIDEPIIIGEPDKDYSYRGWILIPPFFILIIVWAIIIFKKRKS